MILNNPLIVQSDFTILVEVDSPKYKLVRNILHHFSELVKSPEHVHTYKITPLSIWNARSSGMPSKYIIDALKQYSKYDVAQQIFDEIDSIASRYGMIKMHKAGEDQLEITCSTPSILAHIINNKEIQAISYKETNNSLLIDKVYRGVIKQKFIEMGYPIEDLAGYTMGEKFDIHLREITKEGKGFKIRDYQKTAIDAFYQKGSLYGGSGVLTLPCGSGKTIIGIGIMKEIGSSTLILTTSVTSVRQWITEILDKTYVDKDQVGEYSSKTKEINPITVTTYRMLTYKKPQNTTFPHLQLFDQRNWGLIIYDEVHTLPAPIFQITASLQAKRRVGLTATMVREDGKEKDVFSLIGSKKADVSWKELEGKSWLATVSCNEIRVPFSQAEKIRYLSADKRIKFKIASQNPEKIQYIRNIIRKHKGQSIIIMSMYIDQVKEVAKLLNIPVLTGATTQKRRDIVYKDFKDKKYQIIAVTKNSKFCCRFTRCIRCNSDIRYIWL